MHTPQLTEYLVTDNPKRYIGPPCKKCKGIVRWLSSKRCVACKSRYSTSYAKTDKSKKKHREWNDNNRDKVRQYDRKRYAENPEKRCAKNKRWRERNLDRLAAYSAKKRIIKRNATVFPEYDLAIRTVYFGRDMMRDLTGKDYHVDHDIPLQGKFVTGLHVPHNLRVIPANDNLKKSNKFIA